MSRLLLTAVCALFVVSAFAQDRSVAGFNDRFNLVKGADGKIDHIKLKRATRFFTLRPFIEQLKQDILGEQQALTKMSEADIDDMLIDNGLNPYAFGEEGQQEAQAFKDSILNLKNIDVEAAFTEMNAQSDFWAEFQSRLNEAALFLDPTVVANLNDSRFFYKKAVTHKVVVWALEQAQKRFSNIPVLGMVSFVIVRVHDMMLEQRHFAHNMLLHYFETVGEGKLGMSKEEVDRATSSIYEYRIEATNIFESNNAARDWLNYGMNKFYVNVRSGNVTVRDWNSGLTSMNFKAVKKLNFAFASVEQEGVRKIYHLNHKAHQFSMKPSLAYNYAKPKQVKQLRALLNIGGTVIGFVPQIPAWLKSAATNFMHSFYVQQVRTEGALVGYFESTGDSKMMKEVYSQRSNLYIVE